MEGGILMISPHNFLRYTLKLLVCLLVLCSLSPLALAMSLPSMAEYRISEDDLLIPEKGTGIIMGSSSGTGFILNEKKHLLCRESEINGKPAEQATFTLRKGTKVKVVRYRLKNNLYFVSSLTILQ
jgi:hypothetical protein